MVPHTRIIEEELSGVLSDENRHRLERVLRLRPGNKFVITDGHGNETEATLEKNGAYSAEKWETPEREPNIDVTLFVSVSKGDRLEWIIEKAVEMGVRKIVPVISERCIVKDPGKTKTDRWQKIAASAMIQCGGCILPEVLEPAKLSELPKPETDVIPVLLHEEALDFSVHGLKEATATAKKVWLISGPEGGFTDQEVETLFKAGWKAIWLGRRLFRMDTAPIVALANIMAAHWL